MGGSTHAGRNGGGLKQATSRSIASVARAIELATERGSDGKQHTDDGVEHVGSSGEGGLVMLGNEEDGERGEAGVGGGSMAETGGRARG